MDRIDQLYQPLDEPVAHAAAARGIRVMAAAHYLDFCRENKIVRISLRHYVYAEDIVASFDYYHDAVNPIEVGGILLVDYSTPRYHDVASFDAMPVYFPSFAEPIITTNQYLEFADISPGDVVVDLGAYAGLTSIVFRGLAGGAGRVVAVDADPDNVVAIRKNIGLHERMTGQSIDLIHAAVWNHCDGLEFASEGNMGSAVSGMMGGERGAAVQVDSITLSALADRCDLPTVDFIKCDVEGAELVVFEDAAFFDRHRPRIIIEAHLVGEDETTDKCVADLEGYGYRCERIQQHGVTLPLVECHPRGE